ncbi:MAG: DUF6569 family protein [Nitrospirota bacterium]
MKRRTFIIPVGLLFLVAAVLGPEPGDARSIKMPNPGIEDESVKTIRSGVSSLRVGKPISHDGLTLFPLVPGKNGANGKKIGEIRTMDEALEAGSLVVRESGRGVVETLVVENRGDAPVLLMAGEILVGGKQNRTLRQDVLLPPRSGEVSIPTYCVEEGRWREKTSKFDSGGTLAHPSLRKEALKAAPQAKIWREVRERSQSAGVQSATGDVQAYYGDKKVAQAVEKGAEEIEKRGFPSDALGVVAVRGARVVGVDLFAGPYLFAKLRRKVIKTYLFDDPWKIKPVAGGEKEVEGLLKLLADKAWESVPSPGVGRLFRMEGNSAGTALVYRAGVVHLAVLP